MNRKEFTKKCKEIEENSWILDPQNGERIDFSFDKYYKEIKEIGGISIGTDTTCHSADDLIDEMKNILKNKNITCIIEDPATKDMDWYGYIVLTERKNKNG